MRFHEVEHQTWAKRPREVALDLSGSGAPTCPVRFLRLGKSDFATHHAAGYGWPPLVETLAERYGVGARRVLPVSGGTSLATWVGCAAALDDAGAHVEAIVEAPTYEPLHRAPASLGATVRRLERRIGARFGLDLDRLAALVTPRTRLLVLSDLHNPSGVRLAAAELRDAARILARVRGYVLVDEVYLESLWGDRAESAVRLAPNVLATSSLTKAYGLDGLRAGWLIVPAELVAAARRVNDHLGVNGVATGERMALAALRNLPAIRARVAPRLRKNLNAVRRWLDSEERLRWVEPAGGTVSWLRLPAAADPGRFERRLLRRYGTLVAPGRLFGSPRFFRVGLTRPTSALERGLARISRTLDDLGAGRAGPARHDRGG